MIWRKACYRRISSFYCALKAHPKESRFHSGLLFYASIACFYFYSWCCKFRIWNRFDSFILRCQSGKSSLKTDKGEGRCLLRLIEETNYCICDSISSFSPCQLSQMYEWNPLDSSICWDKDKLTPSFLITKPISKCYTICLAAALVKRTARTVVPTKNAIPWGYLYSGSPSKTELLSTGASIISFTLPNPNSWVPVAALRDPLNPPTSIPEGIIYWITNKLRNWYLIKLGKGSQKNSTPDTQKR